MVVDRAQLVEMLTKSGAVRFGEFTLTSGKRSDVYVDIKRAWTEPSRLRLMAEALAARVGECDRLAGMELGAVPLVVATALETQKPYCVLRKASRTHGTGQRIEGEVPSGDRVLLIEDVATTGGSAAESVELLRGAGAVVTRAVVVVDRREGASDRLNALGVTLEPLVTLDELRESRR
jgi:orotate phosphoribosyltransferase